MIASALGLMRFSETDLCNYTGAVARERSFRWFIRSPIHKFQTRWNPQYIPNNRISKPFCYRNGTTQRLLAARMWQREFNKIIKKDSTFKSCFSNNDTTLKLEIYVRRCTFSFVSSRAPCCFEIFFSLVGGRSEVLPCVLSPFDFPLHKPFTICRNAFTHKRYTSRARLVNGTRNTNKKPISCDIRIGS